MALISLSRRLRRTPFSDAVEAAGVSGYTVYNHMLLPTVFESVEYDYHHLKRHVQIWDVSVERQVELKGPDAARLMQMLTPRNLANMTSGQCLYVPIVDETGGMLNDPVALKLAEDHFWISIADSDLLLWAKGLACGFGLDVRVHEPDVNPLAIQGPKSNELATRVFGEDVAKLRFFRFARFNFQGESVLVARSGYSKQGGFEVYVEDRQLGMRIWEALAVAGQDLDVRAGCPNAIERIEGGLLSYGNDMTRDNTPFECGLGRFCNIETPNACVGWKALRRDAGNGPSQHICPIEIQERVPASERAWSIYDGDREVGQLTSAIWSPDFGCTVAIGMVHNSHWDPGTSLRIETQEGPVFGVVKEAFWA